MAGLSGFEPSKTVPKLMRFVGDADRNTAKTALEAAEKIFKLCDPATTDGPAAGKFWSLVGKKLNGERAFVLCESLLSCFLVLTAHAAQCHDD